jgi:hypothetical protein
MASQRRLASVFGTKQSEMVPTQASKLRRPVSEGFTPPKGTVPSAGTGRTASTPKAKAKPTPKAKAAPAPKAVKKSSPKPTAKKAEPATPKAKYAGWTQSRFEKAIARAYDQGDDAKVAALQAAMAKA